jgi:thiamine pyrophosphokinase
LGKPVRITTEGLKYDLNGEILSSSGHGISNEVIGDSFSVTTKNGTVLVFIAHSL